MTAYFGERDRSGTGFLADRILEVTASEGIERSMVLRGSEGFGIKHRHQTSNLLSLSEDLPMLAIATGERGAILAAAREVRSLAGQGLVTVEHCSGSQDRGRALYVWLRRGQRLSREPAHVAVVRLLSTHGADSAATLLGVDGTAGARRERARFFSWNGSVPLLVSATGDPEALSRAATRIESLLPGALLEFSAAAGDFGAATHRRLTIHGTEAPGPDGRAHHSTLVRAVRESGGSGASVLTGTFGFAGDSAPRGDSFLQLRRRVPVLTEIVDTHENCERWASLARGLGGTQTPFVDTPVTILPI